MDVERLRAELVRTWWRVSCAGDFERFEVLLSAGDARAVRCAVDELVVTLRDCAGGLERVSREG